MWWCYICRWTDVLSTDILLKQPVSAHTWDFTESLSIMALPSVTQRVKNSQRRQTLLQHARSCKKMKIIEHMATDAKMQLASANASIQMCQAAGASTIVNSLGIKRQHLTDHQTTVVHLCFCLGLV